MSLYDWYLLTATLFFTIFSLIAVGTIVGVVVLMVVIKQTVRQAQKQLQLKMVEAEKLKLSKGLWYLVQAGFMLWKMKKGQR